MYIYTYIYAYTVGICIYIYMIYDNFQCITKIYGLKKHMIY